MDEKQLSIEEEDKIIKTAKSIQDRYYEEAQRRWYETPDSEKKRPWPRCHNLVCNRTLVCLQTNGKPCEGFDF